MPIRCGAAAVDITPDKFVGMAGYSLAGKIATGVSGRLHARALYIEDGRGSEAALCFIDLMSASRLLLDRATSLTGGVISSSQVLLAGTHTHTGPGRFYGNKFYDRFAQAGTLLSLDPFDEEIASFIAKGIATALLNARRSAVNALIGFGVEELWGIARNRSHVPFSENPESAAWKGIHPPPRTLPPDQLAVDPRVSSLVAVTDAARELIGAFALYSCHATALGPKADTYDPDWPGVAVEAARRQLGNTGVIAIATSAAADQSPTRSDRPQGLELARFVGNAVGDAVAKATIRGMQNATTVTVHSVFTEFDPISAKSMAVPRPASARSGPLAHRPSPAASTGDRACIRHSRLMACPARTSTRSNHNSRSHSRSARFKRY
jgi:neutral ceramidase